MASSLATASDPRISSLQTPAGQRAIQVPSSDSETAKSASRSAQPATLGPAPAPASIKATSSPNLLPPATVISSVQTFEVPSPPKPSQEERQVLIQNLKANTASVPSINSQSSKVAVLPASALNDKRNMGPASSAPSSARLDSSSSALILFLYNFSVSPIIVRQLNRTSFSIHILFAFII